MRFLHMLKILGKDIKPFLKHLSIDSKSGLLKSTPIVTVQYFHKSNQLLGRLTLDDCIVVTQIALSTNDNLENVLYSCNFNDLSQFVSNMKSSDVLYVSDESLLNNMNGTDNDLDVSNGASDDITNSTISDTRKQGLASVLNQLTAVSDMPDDSDDTYDDETNEGKNSNQSQSYLYVLIKDSKGDIVAPEAQFLVPEVVLHASNVVIPATKLSSEISSKCVLQVVDNISKLLRKTFLPQTMQLHFLLTQNSVHMFAFNNTQIEHFRYNTQLEAPDGTLYTNPVLVQWNIEKNQLKYVVNWLKNNSGEHVELSLHRFGNKYNMQIKTDDTNTCFEIKLSDINTPDETVLQNLNMYTNPDEFDKVNTEFPFEDFAKKKLATQLEKQNLPCIQNSEGVLKCTEKLDNDTGQIDYMLLK